MVNFSTKLTRVEKPNTEEGNNVFLELIRKFYAQDSTKLPRIALGTHEWKSGRGFNTAEEASTRARLDDFSRPDCLSVC
eukprot:UN03622